MKTPQQPAVALAAALDLSGELYLKREDLHPYGSHKGRSIPLMIKEYHKQGIRHFVISSSGNAALAAICAVAQHNKNKPNDPLRLDVFIGKKIPAEKLQSLQKEIGNSTGITLDQVDNPKQHAFQLEKAGETKNLRQSTDDLALAGYQELTTELDKIPDLAAIFIPTSSGTTAQGLGIAFKHLTHKPQIHIVQTTSCHTIAEHWNTTAPATDTSIAGAIVDQVAHRKKKVIETIIESQGSGWIVTDEEISEAMLKVKQTEDIKISPNSALSVAGLNKAIKKGWTWSGPVACLITGK